eukprot:TRINITY_DN4378_c8_g2_i1.p1 TRINITY_DN4378_c8_g2~~TRINITY_DN4378_c8_g2_i1.p1  ORF type:complete len:366 (+),score=130.42 TRINITY_DN4378_c8_g2_i1:72-1100(+)
MAAMAASGGGQRQGAPMLKREELDISTEEALYECEGDTSAPPEPPAPPPPPPEIVQAIDTSGCSLQDALAHWATLVPRTDPGGAAFAGALTGGLDVAALQAELAAVAAEVAELRDSAAAMGARDAGGSPRRERPAPAPAGPAPYITPAALSALQQRVGALEELVGPPPQPESGLPREGSAKRVHSLCIAVSRLQERLGAIDPEAAESLRRRLETTAWAMRQVAERHRRQPEDENQPQTAHVVWQLDKDFAEHYDGLADELPGVAERLLTLRELHDEAGQVHAELRAAAAAAEAADAGLDDVSDVVRRLRAAMEEDERRSAASAAHLAERMGRLQAALQRLGH